VEHIEWEFLLSQEDKKKIDGLLNQENAVEFMSFRGKKNWSTKEAHKATTMEAKDQ